VADSGCGIPAADLPKIFSHGFTTRVGGHGFGLHSCAVAAREMGGSLTVQSAGPGAGARFTLTLPVAQQRTQAAGRASPEAVENAGPAAA
jgi:two-component system NtrC family sensor kinase